MITDARPSTDEGRMNPRPRHLHVVRDDEPGPVEPGPGQRIDHASQARPGAIWVLGSILGYAVGSAIVALLFG